MKTKVNPVRIFVLWAGLILLAYIMIDKIIEDNWLFGSGTHGSIKAYLYPVKKRELEQAIDRVISKSFYINSTSKESLNGATTKSNNSINGNLPDFQNAYKIITISTDNEFNSYTFRYLGDESNWENDSVSEIFIAYAYDKNGNGGSEGSGGFPWYRPNLKKRLISVFEKEFLDKVNKELRVKYIEIE